MSRRRSLYTKSDTTREKDPETRAVVGPEPYRSEYRRDYARLIHSPSFRRLQGKTQVFPGIESDFFRNRMMHSLEVAQIGRSLAIRLNHLSGQPQRLRIDPDLVELAGLAHDLGHPPFGHNGEEALDERMLGCGGFEGNAQTLRIVSRVEKKDVRDSALLGDPNPCGVRPNGDDERLGLNWTYRSLAAILKYDRQIPHYRSASGIVKGYYSSETALVNRIKKAIEPGYSTNGKFKTIECSIMDIADDIAYSTYDLEDTFKAGFLSPLDIISSDEKSLERVAAKVSKALGSRFDAQDVMEVYIRTFRDILGDQSTNSPEKDVKEPMYLAAQYFTASRQVAEIGFLRTRFTAGLVSRFISGISIDLDEAFPSMSKIKVDPQIHAEIEAFKHYTFEATIMSARLRVSEKRGADIVREIYDELSGDGGHRYLPNDVQTLYARQIDDSGKKRLICDFIAGMTDRYQ